eukprot:11956902-Karenia_brevis.AAC.1
MAALKLNMLGTKYSDRLLFLQAEVAALKLITSDATSGVTPSWRPSSQAVMAALELIMSHSKGN